MSAERLIASHLRLASEALAAARTLLDIGNRNAAYQAEQAVEQIILALAQAETLAFTRAQQHQLDTMRRALPGENPFRERLAKLTWLEAHATTYRYPRTAGGISEPPPKPKLASALDQCSEILDDLAQHFAIDLHIDAREPAAHAKPPRTDPRNQFEEQA